ncbi:MAG: ABC transporter ATP-binding protein [Actinomycetota bacterium]
MSSLVEIGNVSVRYRLDRSSKLIAVNDISMDIDSGTILGLVGESGCGKSSFGRAIAGIRPPTSGRIRIDGRELTSDRTRDDARLVQMVVQDPSSALNPARTIGSTITELLLVHGLAVDRSTARNRAEELLDSVELPASVFDRRPDALSGGQRQRVGIARALALQPQVLIADEAVAALDSIVKKSVVRLLAQLRKDLGLTIIFISHDLTVVRQLCDDIAVMYLGRIVERQSTEALFHSPRHPYTAALLAAQPRVGHQLDVTTKPALAGDPPSPIHIGSGCAFASRCSIAQTICTTMAPVALDVSSTSMVRCHFPLSTG